MKFSEEQIHRYSRQIILPGIGWRGQRKLAEAKVFIMGAGGLGSPAAIYLAAAGVGTMGWPTPIGWNCTISSVRFFTGHVT
jgi:molybdopterin/thiamine biosynthesis adenylyltransferase